MIWTFTQLIILFESLMVTDSEMVLNELTRQQLKSNDVHNVLISLKEIH